MFQIRLIAIGDKLPTWANSACAHYTKSMRAFAQFELVEIPLSKHHKHHPERAVEAEGEQLLAQLKPQDFVVAYDVTGQPCTTEQLAQKLGAAARDSGQMVALIGGPEGLSAACLDRANAAWSLSKLTFPHALARVVAIESLYRGLSLLHNHPYHRS